MANINDRLSEFSKKYLIEYQNNADNTGLGHVGSSWGERLNDVPGWEYGTAGMYGDIRLGRRQVGIKNLEPASLALVEPLRLGHFLWKCIKIPPFFHPKVVDVFRFVFEGMVKEVSGIPQNTISVITQNFGPVGAAVDYPGIYQESGKEVTIKTTEVRASVVRKMLNYWIGGMSDRETGIGTLYGKNIPYAKSNYAASFIYVVSGITGRVEDIEYACIYHECFPTSEVTSHMSTVTLGDAGSVGDVDITLTGIYQVGPEVDILAQFCVAAWGIYSESAENQTLPTWTYNLYFNYAQTEEGLTAMKRNFSVKHHDNIETYLHRVQETSGDRNASKLSWTDDILKLRWQTPSGLGPQAIIGGDENDPSSPNRVSNQITFESAFEAYKTKISERNSDRWSTIK